MKNNRRTLQPILGMITLLILGIISVLISGCNTGTNSHGKYTTVTLKSIEVILPVSSIPKGLTTHITARGTYTDNSEADITDDVTWISSDTSIAAISQTGEVRGVIPGTVTIQATLDDIESPESSFRVTEAELVSLQIDTKPPVVEKGMTVQFAATGVFTDGIEHDVTDLVTWFSSNEAVAPVDESGLATAETAGETTITCSYEDREAPGVLMTVTPAELVSIAIVSPQEPISLSRGLTRQFEAEGTFDDGTTANITGAVTWESSQTSSVEISNEAAAKGLATGFAPGESKIKAVSGDIESPEVTVTVTGFEFTIEVPSAAYVYTLPLIDVFGYTHAFTVYWGDGSSSEITSFDDPDRVHTYATAGSYQVVIDGNCPGFRVDDDATYRSIYKSVDSWGNAGFRDLNFYGCINLATLPDEAGRLTQVRNFDYTFTQCSNLTSLPAGLFDNNTEVTSFIYTFYGCSLIDSIPAGLFDKNTKVTSFEGTFAECSSLSSIPAELFEKNTEVTSFYATFAECSRITSIPAGLFDKNTKVTSFGFTFFLCSGIISIPAGLFDNNTEVTSFNDTFTECSSLTSIPAGLFDNNMNVTSFWCTFYNCSSIAGDVILATPQPWARIPAPIGMECFRNCNPVPGQITNWAEIVSAGWN